MAKGNGKAETKEATPSVPQLLKAEQEARKEWYGHFNGGAPKKPFSKEASASLRKLEKAKAALVAAVPGASNFKEAAKELNYSPLYAPRTRTATATKK